MQENPASFSKLLRHRIAEVEKRDWELWTLALAAAAIPTAGVALLVLPPVISNQRTIHLEANLSPQLVVGLLVLMVLLSAYLIQKHIQIRRLRFQSIVDTWDSEISSLRLLVDPLTKVLNRHAVEDILSKEINRVKRNQSTLMFLYADVDEFKRINTCFGHLTGDLVLSEVGGLLKSCVRGCDYVIRMGGDEFLIALVDTDCMGAEAVRDRIRSWVAVWNQNSPLRGFTLRLSIGVQQFDCSKSLDEVLSEADSKMYVEKNRQLPVGQFLADAI